MDNYGFTMLYEPYGYEVVNKVVAYHNTNGVAD